MALTNKHTSDTTNKYEMRACQRFILPARTFASLFLLFRIDPLGSTIRHGVSLLLLSATASLPQMEGITNRIEDIEVQIGSIEELLKTFDELLKKDFSEWTGEQQRQYGNHEQLRRKEELLRKEKEQLREEKLIVLKLQQPQGMLFLVSCSCCHIAFVCKAYSFIIFLP